MIQYDICPFSFVLSCCLALTESDAHGKNEKYSDQSLLHVDDNLTRPESYTVRFNIRFMREQRFVRF